MTKLDSLFDLDLLAQMEAEGFIRRNRHPELPLFILNYTEQAQFSRTWNEVTLQCRGLVIDDQNDVIARPLRKFFNLTERPLPDVAFQVPPVVCDKLDGSLGIIFEYDGQTHVCTRGSFASEQAQWATAWLAETHPDFAPPPGITPLAEIIYPSNRIVIDYGSRSELTLLAAIEIDSGADVPVWEAAAFWPGSVVTMHPGFERIEDVETFATGDDKDGEEGVVATWYRAGAPSIRCKIKHADYVRLHAIITRASTKTVWRALRDGVDPLAVAGDLPDEFHAWLKATVANLQDVHDGIAAAAAEAFSGIEHLAGDRKAFAAAAVQSEYRGLLFALLDGKDIGLAIWRQIEPEYERPFAEEV